MAESQETEMVKTVGVVDYLLQSGEPKNFVESIKNWLLLTLVLVLPIFHIYTATFESTESYSTRTFVVSLAMVLGLIFFPTGRKSWTTPANRWTIADGLVIGFIILVQGYVLYAMESTGGELIAGLEPLTTSQMVVGVIYALILLEITRRCAGIPMLVIVLAFVLYVLFGQYLPAAVRGISVSPEVLIGSLFYRLDGIFGVPIGAMTDYVIIFIFFGEMLTAAGAGGFFTDIAVSLTGKQVGGPAKAAIVSSSLMGTMSGSAISNVVTTGAVTIPLMKRSGFTAVFAGAVEAVASSGGQIMPPVMGAVAFIMAQMMGVNYFSIVLAAVLPALLYYWCAFWGVHWEAHRQGVGRLPASDIPSLRGVLKSGWYYLIPVLVLIGMIATNQSIILAASWASGTAWLTSLFKKETRVTPIRLLRVCESTTKSSIIVLIVAATAGIIISVVTASGLSWQILGALVDVAGSRLFVALVLAAIMAVILGMGVSTTAVYVTLAAVLAPALIQMGLEPMAAHMFALYYAVIGLITPPVALAAFAAAGIAGADPIKIGLSASKLALPIYIVPFVFAYSPGLLLIGSWYIIAAQFLLALIGTFVIMAAMWGRLWTKIGTVERACLGVGGVLLLIFHIELLMIGILLVVIGSWRSFRDHRRGTNNFGDIA